MGQLDLSLTAQVATIESTIKHRDWEGVRSKPENNLCLAFLTEGEEFNLGAGDEVGSLQLVSRPPIPLLTECDIAGWRIRDQVEEMASCRGCGCDMCCVVACWCRHSFCF